MDWCAEGLWYKPSFYWCGSEPVLGFSGLAPASGSPNEHWALCTRVVAPDKDGGRLPRLLIPLGALCLVSSDDPLMEQEEPHCSEELLNYQQSPESPAPSSE